VKISFRRLFTMLLQDEAGQDLIEYALIAAFIGLGATATLRNLATTISSALTTLGSRLTDVV
jgi:pilus assembly protein Flp/PilA